MSKIIGFFATRKDLLDLLGEVESRRSIHYAESGMFDSPELVIYASGSEIPSLGLTNVHSTVLGRKLLISDVGTSFVCESVPQRRGGTRYAVDQKENPDTVRLFPGGQFDKETILAGDFGTCTDSAVSASLLRVVTRSVRKRWANIRANFVGPEALAVLDAGGRLTDNLCSPPEYDLRR